MQANDARICRNNLCRIDYPHRHIREADNLPAQWATTIDDPAVSAPWPDRLHWQRPPRRSYDGNPYHLFKFGWFSSHAGFQLPWKIDCEDGLADGDWDAIAQLIAWKFAFRSVYGIPKGGTKLAEALDKYCEPGYPIIIVDDVLTTGRSFVHARAALGNPEDVFGVVVFARGPVPDWVWPILTVNEWAQSRATGLG